jgi:Protein of unknown function (DUF2877)
MAAIVTLNVTAASAGLSRLFEVPSWEGRMAAVFRTSLLCLGPHERLLHLHGGPRLVSPFSLRTEDALAGLIQESRLVAGMPVHKTELCLEIPGSIRLWLGEIAYYRSPRDMAGEIDPYALQRAEQLLSRMGHPGGFTAIPGNQAATAAIRGALARRRPDLILNTARRIIGLGPGLTPSGDDFLVGCLRGLWLIARGATRERDLLRQLRTALLPGLEDRTTRVGAEFIRAALDGEFAEVLDRAAVALVSPVRMQTVVSAIGQLLAQGETSGTDTTYGLLTCLDALLAAHQQPQGKRCRSGISCARAFTMTP